jgi:hypothetical protein
MVSVESYTLTTTPLAGASVRARRSPMRPVHAAPVDYAVLEFPLGHEPLASGLATELASLEDAELIHILELVVVHKHADRSITTVAVADLGDLAGLVDGFRPVLTAGDIGRLTDPVGPDRMVAVVVWENTWAEPMLSLARECGGELVATGAIPRSAEHDAAT